jgi:hypothetical protein
MREIDLDALEATLRKVSDPDALCIEQGLPWQRLAQPLAALGIPLIDLVPPFRAAQRSGERPLYRASDRHWSPAGHALAAQTVFEALRDQGRL